MTTAQMYGVKALRRIQLGKEVTPGTQVLSTTRWRGEGTLQDDTLAVIPPEDVGLLVGTDRVYVPSKGGTITLQPTPATYEQLPYLGELGIKGLAAPTADGGGGSGKIYAYPFPTTAQLATNPYSFETGDNARMRLTPWGILESLKLTGKPNEAIMMSGVVKTRAVSVNQLTASTIAFDNTNHITDSANGLAVFAIGQKVRVNGTANNNGLFTVTASAAGSLTVTETTATEAAGTPVTLTQEFTDTATIPTVREILFNQTLLYIDDVGTSIGTTQAAEFLGFEFDYKTGQKGQAAGSGRLDFAFQKAVRPTATLNLTFEMANAAKTEEDKWLAKTPRKVRIKNSGVALTTAGSVYTYYTMILDVIGVYTKFNALEEDDGDDVIKGELTMGYDGTAATAGQLLVVNQLAALP